MQTQTSDLIRWVKNLFCRKGEKAPWPQFESTADAIRKLEGYDVFDYVGGNELDGFGFHSPAEYRDAGMAEPIIRAIMLRSFACEVESGCIHQYLACHSFDDAVYVRESLDIIGETRLAELLGYAIPLVPDYPAMFPTELWAKAAGLPRNPEYQDIEADFREAYDLMKRTFYDNYAKFIKANVHAFVELGDADSGG